MNTPDPKLKKASVIALVAMALLAITGAICYKERAVFSDAAFRLFNMINYDQFDIPGNRYGAFIVQILPYLAMKLHLPVGVILFCYGAGYYLFYLAAALVLVYGFRQYALAILMALFYFLFVTESFIWVSETYIGTAWMFLMFGWVLYAGNKRMNILLLLIPFSVLAFITIFTHFVVIIPTLFLLVYLIVERKQWPFGTRDTLLLTIVLLAVIAFKFLHTSTQPYDTDHLKGLNQFTRKDILSSFSTPVVSTFFSRCYTNYWPAIAVLLLGAYSLVKNRDWKPAAWTLISLTGYIVLMGITYADQRADVLLFHIESEWACIGVLAASGFVFSFLPRFSIRPGLYILAAAFAIRLFYISAALPSFAGRTAMVENILSQMRKKNIPKLALLYNRPLDSLTKLFWGLPYESLLLSQKHGDNPQFTFCIVNPDDKPTVALIRDSSGFFNVYNTLSAGQLNQRYFSVDRTHPYRVMQYEELMK